KSARAITPIRICRRSGWRRRNATSARRRRRRAKSTPRPASSRSSNFYTQRPDLGPGTASVRRIGNRRRDGAKNEVEWEETIMRRLLGVVTAGLLLVATCLGPALAQQSGGILRIGHFASPASMSMLEESTLAVNRPMSGVFNNLVI